MLIVRALILLSLAAVFIQDLKSRAVYWFFFPLITLLFIAVQLLQNICFTNIVQTWATNMLFLLPQFLLLTLYFRLKQGRWINITKNLLGWGDVLLLVSIGFYLSLPAFVLFYLSSLALVILVWGIWQIINKKKDTHIPLAGFQALLLAVLLVFIWSSVHRGCYGDNIILSILNLWN